MSDNAKIETNFNYHVPTNSQIVTFEWLRAAFKNVAYDIDFSCPESREKSIAMTHLETALFWANASIARNPVIYQPAEPIQPIIDEILRGDGDGGA